ncbi:hypothetical protein [Streptomyces diastatochromogenes]|nr:hypothetical protein [Streptomyces diastatochromogenes]
MTLRRTTLALARAAEPAGAALAEQVREELASGAPLSRAEHHARS